MTVCVCVTVCASFLPVAAELVLSLSLPTAMGKFNVQGVRVSAMHEPECTTLHTVKARVYAHPPCTRPVRGSRHFCFKIAPMPMYTPRYAGNTSTISVPVQVLIPNTYGYPYSKYTPGSKITPVPLVYAQEIEAAILYARGPIHGLLRYIEYDSVIHRGQTDAVACAKSVYREVGGM